jgi:hypothetical protein
VYNHENNFLSTIPLCGVVQAAGDGGVPFPGFCGKRNHRLANV